MNKWLEQNCEEQNPNGFLVEDKKIFKLDSLVREGNRLSMDYTKEGLEIAKEFKITWPDYSANDKKCCLIFSRSFL